MSNNSLMLATAKRIPEGIRNIILEEELIDKAVNVQSINSPMEYLFDVYIEFIDRANDPSNFTCAKCREKVLIDLRKLKPFLIELKNGN